ncbi:hypothetical protein F183_A35390 [Bryobacterales bacterium F-183]|nr:hypothetical protein F183_A35390 [Bryobacterales bacterium F-183]
MKRLWREWRRRLSQVGKPDSSDIAEEIEANLQLHIDDNIQSGMSPAEARREAIMKLGGIEPAKESYRDQATVRWMDNLLQDARYSIRQWRNKPGFAVTALVILSMGLAASVAIFSFVYALLLKPLPYKDPAGLAAIYEVAPGCPYCNLSYPDYLDWKAQTQTLSQLEGFAYGGFAMAGNEGPQMLRGARVSAGFFRLLGVRPVVGRDFVDGEDQPGKPLLVMITAEAWRNKFGGSESVIGRRIVLNDKPNEIVGVLPDSFQFAPLGTPEVYQIQIPSNGCETRRSCHGMYGLGRMRPGVGLEAVKAEMAEIARRLERQYPESNRDQGGTADLLTDTVNGKLKPIVSTMFAGVCLLLLIVWANVSSLLLVRSEGRRRELAVRRALGASGARIAGQFVTEAFALVLVSMCCGLVLAHWLIPLLVRMIPDFMLEEMPYFQGLHLGMPELLFAIGIAAATLLVTALTPSLHLLFSKASAGLSEGNRGSGGLSWRGTGAKLVALELATAAVLLVGAGLLARSLQMMFEVDLGFRPERLISIGMNLPGKTYDTDAKVLAVQGSMKRLVESVPGVAAVAYSGQSPITHTGNTTWLHLVGSANDGEKIDLPERAVDPAYFATVGAKLASGRYFTSDDDDKHPRVVIVNRLFANRYFGGQDATGRRVVYHRAGSKPMEIVGMVENLKEGQLDADERPVLYVPMLQQMDTGMVMTVRTNVKSEPLIPLILGKLREQHRDVLMDTPVTMADRIQNSASAYVRRSSAWVVGGFAAMAVLLSVVGLYGVVAYSVSQRTREIGVRMALGAERATVSGLILREAGALCLVGLGVGLIAAVGFASMAKSMLFGVQSWDVTTLVVVVVVLGSAGLLASYIPARRAASVNPVEALRAE